MGASQYELLTLFADGGAMMYPLVLCSLIALGVIIAKAWTLWLAHRNTKTVLREVEEFARAGRLEEAIEVASSTPGPAAAILLAGLVAQGLEVRLFLRQRRPEALIFGGCP